MSIIQREVAERIAAHTSSPDQTIESAAADSAAARRSDRTADPQYNSHPISDRQPSSAQMTTSHSDSRGGAPNAHHNRLDSRLAQPNHLDGRPAGVPPRSDSYQSSRHDAPVSTANTNKDTDRETSGVVKGSSGGPRLARIPVNLPGRMMNNTDVDLRPGSQRMNSYVVNSEATGGPAEAPGPRRDMYAEKPSAGRGTRSPNRADRGRKYLVSYCDQISISLLNKLYTISLDVCAVVIFNICGLQTCLHQVLPYQRDVTEMTTRQFLHRLPTDHLLSLLLTRLDIPHPTPTAEVKVINLQKLMLEVTIGSINYK